jgi:hypothetical protein
MALSAWHSIPNYPQSNTPSLYIESNAQRRKDELRREMLSAAKQWGNRLDFDAEIH